MFVMDDTLYFSNVHYTIMIVPIKDDSLPVKT